MRTGSLAQFYEERIDNSDKARLRGIDAYAKSLRDSVRALWTGNVGLSGFGDAMFSAIERHLEIAWREGAAECGVMPDERTLEETARLNDFIDSQVAYVPAFGKFIQENNREGGGLLRVSLRRLPPWLNRYNEVKAIAQQMACADTKYRWVLGIAEHCKTCLKLSGRVMRASRWAELDVHPQDTRPGKLACNGYNCKCRFEQTGSRVTPGPLPRLP